MAVYSMTGFASVQSQPLGAGQTVSLELRSVNSRFLDLSFRLSDDLRASEPALREWIGSRFKRGKFELRGWIEGRPDQALRPPAPADLQRLQAMQEQIRAWLPDARPLSVAEVRQTLSQHSALPEGIGDTLLSATHQLTAALTDARQREGSRLADAMRERLLGLQRLAQDAAPLIPRLVEQQRSRFLERWRAALAEAGAADPQLAQERALAEATALALRIDVAEELTRLQSHVDEMQTLLERGGEIGKRMEFLIQELQREANTLGSKSSSLELTRISVDMKVLIEQLREQVQNIE